MSTETVKATEVPRLQLVCVCGETSVINIGEPVKCKYCGKTALFTWDGNKRVHYFGGFV